MTDTRKVVKVFLASPSDLRDERLIAKNVADEFNNIWADTLGYQVELVGWEDAVSIFGRPQSVINRDLERCEFFVGLLWKRWGTSPDNGGPYSSGFEEEFCLSVDRKKKLGKPEISLFFKEIQPDLLVDPGDDLKKVIKFKDGLIASKTLLFETFVDPQEFQTKFRRCISNYVKQLHAVESEQPIDAVKSNVKVPTSATKSTSDEAFPKQARAFVNEILSIERREISSSQVARLRLLGQISVAQGNDERTIGTHDANILFFGRESIKFSVREVDGLIDCGLEHFSNENCPLWYWLVLQRAFQRSLMPIFATFGTDNGRCGAFDAMRLIAEPIDAAVIERKKVIQSALSETSESRLKVAVLKYLEECGVSGDLELIRAELSRDDHQTRQAAVQAILGILLNDSRDRALQALVELQVDSIDKTILRRLFTPDVRFDPALLSKGLSSRSAAVRLAIVRQLHSQNAFNNEIAESLLTDGSAVVRLEALLSLIKSGRQFSNEEARRILVRPRSTGVLGLGGGGRDEEGIEEYETFRSLRLGNLTKPELDEVVQSASVLDKAPYFARAEKFFEECGGELRASVADRFVKFFGDTLSRMANSGWTEGQIQQASSLGEFIRKQMTRQGLDIICKKASKEDLELVRTVLKSGSVPYSQHDIEFLQKFGEWSDIELIVSEIERPDYSVALLLLDTSRYDLAARAIYSIGKGRLADLLKMSASPLLISKLVLISTDKDFRSIDDKIIDALLLSEHDIVRKAVALKCNRGFSKGRLKELMARYSAVQTYRYYNVFHWLDFGISIPKDRVVSGVDRIIAAFG